jgi:hypothetical protein
LHEPTSRRSKQGKQSEGPQACNAARLVLFDFALLPLDADQSAKQKGGGEAEREREQLLILHQQLILRVLAAA